MPRPAVPAGPTVAEVGEDALVGRVVARLSAPGEHEHEHDRGPGAVAGPDVLVGPGDDAAVLGWTGPLVVSTDTLVQDVDFRLDWSSGHEVGRKAAVQVMADVEAMGGHAVGLVVSLVVPGSTPLAWCLDLADGLAEEAGRAGARVVGGDVADGAALVVTGTAFGRLDGPADAVGRGGARAGHLVLLGGPVGASAAGLALLQAGRVGSDGLPADAADAVERVLAVHRGPRVDHDAGARARQAGASALIDVSDGLLRDARRLAGASGVVLALDGDALRPGEDVVVVAGLLGADAAEWVLTSGEEHAMLACLPPASPVPDGFVVVGRVREAAADEAPGVTVDGVRRDAGGWTHYDRRT